MLDYVAQNSLVARNVQQSDVMQRQISVEPFLDEMRRVLPGQWRITIRRLPARHDPPADAILAIRAPDGAEAKLLVETKSRLSAQQSALLGARWRQTLGGDGLDGAIVFTHFASRMARERLRSAGISYLDSTGNAWISVHRPAVYVERQGAETDPDPPRRGLRSLRGAKAGRIVRGLCDWRPPVRVRELARRTETNAGYVSRVVSFLESEDVLVRDGQGEVTDVRWEDLLRLWSRDYSVSETNRAVEYLAPRGLTPLREALSSYRGRYALTGQFAVPSEAQVAPGRFLSCYVPSIEPAARELDLRPTESGANVWLLEPFDPVVFERTRQAKDLTTVALTQCVVDLLTGPGREPAQADALISWMMNNENAWRS